MNESERTGRVVAFSLLLWGVAVAAAAFAGVLEKLAAEEVAALSAFTLAYSLATYFVDPKLRAYAREAVRPALAVAAWVLAAALAWISLEGTHDAPLLAHWAAALAALFAAPLAAVLTVAAIERAAALRLSVAKRSAARPAAI